jgi:hypothetical protein
VLTGCTDTAEADQQYEESDGGDSDSDSEDEDDASRQFASASVQLPPVVDGFRNLEEDKCLVNLYMATNGQSHPHSDIQIKLRQAFLSLPRNDWLRLRGNKLTKFFCLHASHDEQLWRRHCVAQMAYI